MDQSASSSSEPARHPGRPPISLRRKLLFTVAFGVLLLLVFEAVVRVRAWVRYGTVEMAAVDNMLVPDAVTGLSVPRPGYVRKSSRISISINSQGFRGGELTIEKPPKTIRIATIGASTTFCGEVSSNDATWPARLQQILQSRHPEVTIQVINAGIPGYVVAESLENVRSRVLRLDPDLVIYYEANNDMAVDTRALALEQGLVERGPSLVARLSKVSLLVDLVQKNARILLAREGSDAKLGALPQNLPDRYIGKLEEMRQLLAERGIPFVTSTFFVKYRRSQPRETQIQNASVAFYYMPWLTIDGLLDGMDLYNDAIVEYARSHGVPVVDDRESVPGDDQHFVDWAHFSDEGAMLMGQRFARFLEDEGLMRKLIAR